MDSNRQVLFLFIRDGVWWVRIHQANIEFDAKLTKRAFLGLLNHVDELYVTYQFMTSDGELMRVFGLDYEKDMLNKLMQVREP